MDNKPFSMTVKKINYSAGRAANCGNAAKEVVL
jgi:hypothetical protein